MPRPENINRMATTISLLKIQKIRMRKFADVDKKRKGNESDSVVLEKILVYYELNNTSTGEPKQTYSN